MRRLASLCLLLAASPALAQQRTEVALLGGYTTKGDIAKKAVGIQELEVEDGFTWTLALTHFFSPHLGAEASFAQQSTALGIGTSAGSAELFDMKVGALQGSFVYRFGGDAARLSPFVAAGLGATFLSGGDAASETKLSWALGVGAKWYPSTRVGLRLQARYVPTVLSDSSSTTCDPFGFCQGSLNQFEFTGGLSVRF